ncbi:contactin-associated protein-like 2 [Diaphorina citri]|uniref:Contactin-associated protein-like 2 n=1 Tax=Diaphorina citri TaxID=121845 RepID=A0A3Q0ILV2_DIACI|nr:contactin-associated protein-like 2 [Diaphorina citri]
MSLCYGCKMLPILVRGQNALLGDRRIRVRIFGSDGNRTQTSSMLGQCRRSARISGIQRRNDDLATLFNVQDNGLCREISFQFRTRLPHGLLVYHSVKDRPEGLDPYALYVIVEKGQLKVVHVFGKHSTSITVGEGLNRDKWHSVMVRINVHGAKLIARVDNRTDETIIKGLDPNTNYGVTSDLTSVVLIGGLSPEEKLHGVKYIIESFIGCIKDMVLSAGKAASDLLPIKPLIATKHEHVEEGCIDKYYELNITGLVGCMRSIFINNVPVEPRAIARNFRQVSLDNCQLVDPCKKPNACEHGGKCSIKDEKVKCDCTDGYMGKNCHFARYRKTCEELALLGVTESNVYLIDIDGNGRFPPARVKCEFQEDSTKTIVEHNLPDQTDVRGIHETDFKFTIKYREFTQEMLSELISHSLYCRQRIKYECHQAPLDLHSATWFTSAANQSVDYVGDVKRGSCECAVNRTCVNPEQSCNCDASLPKWLSDEGHFKTPNSLGITEMVFIQQKDLVEKSMARITLGPLECVETNTQKYVVTFTTSQSYIEVPGWRKGDIAFSFRTTGEKAILLYQPPIRANYPSFMVALQSDYFLTFKFTLNKGNEREVVVNSHRKLNSGEWQKIWIDYNEHHVRVMVNTDQSMVDLAPDEEFGPFEGSMFIGGATEDILLRNHSDLQVGLIGCFRGLVVNGEILDIYNYMSVHLSEIIKDCQPSCDPNPCKNGAYCRELWSTFQCVCENPWAYNGTYCETNINLQGVTFINSSAFIHHNYLLASNLTSRSRGRPNLYDLLDSNILVNIRTYDLNSLLIYANDHLNNFVHLFIQDGGQVVFLFNYGSTVYNVTVEYPDLSNGISVQLALIRHPNETILHVNDKNNSVPYGVLLLTSYSNKPWLNPDKEVMSPQRPPAPTCSTFPLRSKETVLRSNQREREDSNQINEEEPQLDKEEREEETIEEESEDKQEENEEDEQKEISQQGEAPVPEVKKIVFNGGTTVRFRDREPDTPAPVTGNPTENTAWFIDSPDKVPYKSSYQDVVVKEEKTGTVIFIILLSFFIIAVCSIFYHVYRNHLQWKKRKEEETTMMWHKGQPVKFQDSVINTASVPITMIAYKPVSIKHIRSLVNKKVPGASTPIFLNEHLRTYSNPISYLGTPVNMTNSKESIISLD